MCIKTQNITFKMRRSHSKNKGVINICVEREYNNDNSELLPVNCSFKTEPRGVNRNMKLRKWQILKTVLQ